MYFCPVYKNEKFSLRKLEEIKQDISDMKSISDEINKVSFELGFNGDINNLVLKELVNKYDFNEFYRSIATWLFHKTNACFLQDADNLVYKTDFLTEILIFLKANFSQLSRITTYARSKSIYHKSVNELKQILNAGLNRIHIGLESGSDNVLKFMKKGVTAKQHIEAGKKAIKAGIELSVYVMPGLGGKTLSKENAIETAKVINEINPNFIRIRSLRIPESTPLYSHIFDDFEILPDDDTVKELKLFIENLNNISSTIASDHIMNILEDVSGELPFDKDKILNTIDEYLGLPDKDKKIFKIGRIHGVFRKTNSLKTDHESYNKISQMVNELELNDKNAVNNYIMNMVNQYL